MAGMAEKFFDLVKLPFERLGAAEQRFHTLIEGDVDGMVVISSNGTVSFVNPAAEVLFEQGADEMIGKPFPFPLNPYTAIEIEIAGQDGKLKVAEMRVSPIVWERKKSHLASIRDITELKKLAHLKVEIDETRRMDKMKDEFIGAVSHELRTPLTIIKAAVGNLSDGIVGEINPKQAKVLEATRRNIDRLVRLIEDLLDLSRLKSGRAQMRPRRIQTAQLIRETILALAPAAEAKNIVISIDLPSELPALYADPDMLVQVLNNLLQNALRFARKKIVVKAEAITGASASVQVMVGDDGSGIPQDRQEDIFKKFVQLDRPIGGSGYKGAGLGLAICKEIINWHEGKIWVESKPGQGANFYFQVPQAVERGAFQAALRDAIRWAEEGSHSLGLLAIGFENIDAMRANCGEEAVQSLSQQLEEKIRFQLLRKGDHLFLEPHGVFLVILAETAKIGIKSVETRICKLAEACRCVGRGHEMIPQLKSGRALFPEDGADVDQLLAVARGDGEARASYAEANSDR